MDFSVQLIDEVADPLNDNADVIVTLTDGSRWIGTAFTLANVQEIMKRHERSGESAGGRYFWAPDMLIVRELTEEALELTVADLIRDECLHVAFSRYDEGEGDVDEEDEEE